MIRRGDGKAGLARRACALEQEVDRLELDLVLAAGELETQRITAELVERRADLREIEAQLGHE